MSSSSERNKGPRDDRWYLNLMAPNTKGPKFAWLDPTSIYINGEAFHDLLDDLVADLKGLQIDVVGGLDAEPEPAVSTPWVSPRATACTTGLGWLARSMPAATASPCRMAPS